MTFPDPPDFKFAAPGEQSMTSVAKQIGNAVPPMLAHRIAADLVQHLDTAVVSTDREAVAA
jgi:site-specific DNA-cytosine methylase